MKGLFENDFEGRLYEWIDVDDGMLAWPMHSDEPEPISVRMFLSSPLLDMTATNRKNHRYQFHLWGSRYLQQCAAGSVKKRADSKSVSTLFSSGARRRAVGRVGIIETICNFTGLFVAKCELTLLCTEGYETSCGSRCAVSLQGGSPDNAYDAID